MTNSKFMVSIQCPKCKEKILIHRARLHNWIHKCPMCKHSFMVFEKEVDES